MSHSTKIPLDLFQVLEEEFVTLHGTPAHDGSQTVTIPDARNRDEFHSVTATLDWNFDPSHIKDARGLAFDLISTWEAQNDPEQLRALSDVSADEWAQNNLLLYMCKRLGAGLLTDINAGLKGAVDLRKVLADALNDSLLPDADLFDEARFTFHRLSTKGQALVTSPLASDTSKDEEDIRHFNRVLLEDAFPDYLERIRDIRLAAIYKRIHEVRPAALCFSGGGIRSGTFALGVLQGLARHKLLDKFHYLSTVSGGGYIGGWLAGWIHRHPAGLEGVTAELANTHPRTKVDPDPGPIRFLRRYSSFITPKVGLLSADTWTFIGIYLRNLFLNWIVFIPLLLSVLILPRIILAITLAQPAVENQVKFSLAAFGSDKLFYGRHLFLIGGFALTVWALAYIIFNRPTFREELRQYSSFWRTRSDQRSFLKWCLFPLTVAAFCLTTYYAWSAERSGTKNPGRFILFGLAVSIVAWFISAVVLGRLRRITKLGLSGILTLDNLALLVAGTLGGLALWVINLIFTPIKPQLECPPTGSDWSQITWNSEIYAAFAVPIFMLVFLLGATLFIGVSSASRRIDDEDREWWARLSAWQLIVILGWSVFTSLVIFGPIAVLSAPKILASVGGLSGLLAVLLGRSEKTPGAPKSPNQEGTEKGGILAAIMSKLLPLLAVTFIAALIVALSLATTIILKYLALRLGSAAALAAWIAKTPPGFGCYVDYTQTHLVNKETFEAAKITHMNVLHYTSLSLVFALGLGLLLFGRIVSRIMNLNIFSLHGGYRNRLIRAFLGASRPDHERKPNPFTGFDPADNLSLHELRAGLFRESDFGDSVALANALLNGGKPAKGGLPELKNPAAQSDKDQAIAKSTDNAALVAAISNCLNEKRLLSNVERVPNKLAPSTRLLAALRRDLNGALQDPEFYSCLLQLPVKAELDHDQDYISQSRRALEIAFPDLIRRHETVEDYRLMPVINTTLNLVGGDNLAWQQRKAEPFSVTPLHAGCFRLGYRDSRLYGGRGGISIGTAAAISGAAASSNMGYYTTSPVLSLVLTFFNVRLGWWLGNPGPAGNDTYYRNSPRYSVAPILDEAFGMTDDRNEYVYLTDGGHFENLGIYEMVLRRCHVIVISDAAADGEYHFGDLGNAIRKVRIDLGIPIEFTALPIFAAAPASPEKGMYWAAARIQYSCIDGPDVEDGLLLYIKPAVYGNEPRDVLEYKKSHPTFPHQSTADQFFDEPQFESYRILGSHIMDQICGDDRNSLGLYAMLRKALDQLTEVQNGTAPPDPKLKKWKDEWFTKVMSRI